MVKTISRENKEILKKLKKETIKIKISKKIDKWISDRGLGCLFYKG